MGFWIFMLCMTLLTPVIMIVFGWIFTHRPPEPNGIYGYRTRRSTASREAWYFAHGYLGRIWFRMGTAMLVISVPVMLSCIGRSKDAIGCWGGSLEGVQCALMILTILPTEKALKRRFR